MKKVYILLEHFYDADDYLINSFIDVKSTYKGAKSLLKPDSVILTDNDFEICNGERKVKEFGGYRSESKFEIREVEL